MIASCPFPFEQYPRIVMAHGGGGRLMKRLLDELIIPTLVADSTDGMHDAAVLTPPADKRVVMTTDSFVIKPMIFPGGDIGCLSVYGTVNDLAMAGAKPLYISVGLILEEGLEVRMLWHILHSMRQAADRTGIKIVTGDTKVVENGKGDGVYINTTGVGFVGQEIDINPQQIRKGDVVLLNGDIGRHGIAVMAQREGLSFDTTIESDCMPLDTAVTALANAGIELHCLRDVTRGGLSSVLNELASSADKHFQLNEQTIPVDTQVASACELLGLDPYYVACEGRFVVILPEKQASHAVQVLNDVHPELTPCIIGQVTALEDKLNPVTLRSVYGAIRPLDMLSGEQLPRIC